MVIVYWDVGMKLRDCVLLGLVEMRRYIALHFK
jgi:hypothetical protein